MLSTDFLNTKRKYNSKIIKNIEKYLETLLTRWESTYTLSQTDLGKDYWSNVVGPLFTDDNLNENNNLAIK